MMGYGRILRAAALVIAAGALSVPASAYDLRRDPYQVVGPDDCGECHKSSVEAWKGSSHFKTFQDLPRSDKAREIAGKMGISRIKAESDCLTCHFTSKPEGPVAGISCESCHGAGQNYIKVHSDYGGKQVTRETEDPGHRAQRWAQAEAAGMIRPTDLYALTENCYQCHTVPNERLVNTGGHPAGSNFELVSWSQGEVRHNVWYTNTNQEADQNRKRMMFIIGQMIDLEYALRGVAKATQRATYAVEMAKRADLARSRLAAINGRLGGAAPEVSQAAAIGASAQLSLNNPSLAGTADQIKAQAQAFARNHDGSAFGAIDSAIPTQYKGQYIQPAPN